MQAASAPLAYLLETRFATNLARGIVFLFLTVGAVDEALLARSCPGFKM